MKKLIALLIAMTLCMAVILPVAATEFVPSISYKDNPDIVGDPEIKDDDGEEVPNVTLVVTPVADALNKDPEDRVGYEDVLVDVYEQLKESTVEIPFPDTEVNYVVRDLIDISLVDSENPEVEVELPTGVEITFDLGVKADATVLVYVYIDNVWEPVEIVVNNGDGTITCYFENIGPVSFCVEDEATTPPSPTGDKSTTRDITPLIIVMVASSAALILLVAFRRKISR